MGEFKYLVIDTETSLKNKGEESVGNFKASPFHPDNEIVMMGEVCDTDDRVSILTKEDMSKLDLSMASAALDEIANQEVMLVGQNIGFDMLYLYKFDSKVREKYRHALIWDTMIVEYLLTGQRKMFCSLDELALKYYGATEEEIQWYLKRKSNEAAAQIAGTTEAFDLDMTAFLRKWHGVLKDDKIKEYWNAGMETEDIPEDELKEYLIGDVRNTEHVFLAQFDLAYKLGMLPLIRTQMDARLATIEMEWNGMFVNKSTLKSDGSGLLLDINILKSTLNASIMGHCKFPVGAIFDVSCTSPKVISAVLFGGLLPYKIKEPMLDDDDKPVLYKSGPHKGLARFKTATKLHEVKPGIPGRPEAVGSVQGALGQWSTGESVLKKIADKYKIEFVEDLLKLRTMDKDYTAFYKSTEELIWHDGCVHPTYNHTATATGRLSCSKPNLQQVSSS